MKNNCKIGIIGGVGPLATTIFFKKVIDYTDAKTDQDNVNMVILNDTDIPDRTEYLLDNTKPSPLEYLLNDIDVLSNTGCTHIALVCNTAHFFFEDLTKKTNLKLINMITETLDECSSKKMKKIGLMATRGTIETKIYEKFNNLNIEIMKPSDDIQNKIDDFIYEKVKKNEKVLLEDFEKVLNYFYNNDCDGIILGCTELSVIIDEYNVMDERIVDSTTVLAKKVVLASGKMLKE